MDEINVLKLGSNELTEKEQFVMAAAIAAAAGVNKALNELPMPERQQLIASLCYGLITGKINLDSEMVAGVKHIHDLAVAHVKTENAQ
jgi:hypothetical protein